MSTPDSFTERLAALSPAKRALLGREMRRRNLAASPTRIERRRSNAQLPLSFGQRRLWFLSQLEPESYVYNEPYAIRLRGDLNANALRLALGKVVERHEVLRSSFTLLNGEPQQHIAAPQEFELPVVDMTSHAAATVEMEAQRYIDRIIREPFDLHKDLLVRAHLLRLADNDYIFLLLTHHVASDGWSRSLLFEEISSFYQSFAARSSPQAEPLPIQYADYAIWQRELLKGEYLEEHLSYWRKELAGLPPLHLPTTYLRPAAQRYAGARYSFNLDSGLGARLAAFNRLENTTAFMSLLGAFQVLLSRWSGQEQVVVGSPIANRQQVELEKLIGFFVNTLVLRGDLSGEPSFREVVRRTRRKALDAYSHQDLPFDKLVEDLNPERDLSRHPLFQVMFVLQNAPAHPLFLRGLEITPFPVSTEATPLDLELHLTARGDTYSGMISYDTDLFDLDTVKRMAGHYNILLESMLTDPDLPVFKATMLTPSERQQLVVDWNDNTTDYGRPECIHELFEQQTAKSPERIAVQVGNQSLTYGELNSRAGQLAGHLRDIGVKRETRVGICVERSLEMVIALMAILKTGGTYVPIDNHFPADRITLILKDSGVQVLVLHESLRSICRGFCGTTVSLDSLPPTSESNVPAATVSGRDAAYIYYTSGSTGRPKGALLEHRSVVNFLRGMQQRPGITESDVVLALTIVSFDPAVLDVFLPLTVGARLVIAPESIRGDAEQIITLMNKSGATILQATPTTWQLLMDKNWANDRLKALIGGEMLTPELARDVLSRCREVWNIYGPTEATVWSTAGRIEDYDEIHVGRPIPNQRTYLVDRHNQIVPVGVPGELLIAGAGLAREYVSQPELTSGSFVPNPLSSSGEDRVYRTGDFCRYDPNGNLHFHGRIDHQIKIRGFRVELGEIEAALAEHPAVRQCVVINRPDRSGHQRLVAYMVVGEGKGEPDTVTLRHFLRKTLPDYMVPTIFVVLPQFPLTASGKVNRSALPEPAVQRTDPVGHALPHNPIQRRIARIWEDVLHMEGIGIENDFFDIGGHSLMAVRLMSQIDAAFDIHLPLATIFREPTIAGLSLAVQNCAELRQQLPGLIASGNRNHEPIVFWAPSVGSVERFIECHNLARLLRDKFRFYGFDPAPQFLDIPSLAQHCVDLIRAEQPNGPYRLAGYCQCGHVAHEIACRLESSGETIALLAMIDCSARELAPNLRQRLYWFRDGLRGTPQVVGRRLQRAIATRLRPAKKSNGSTFDHSDNQFSAHARAANRHRARRLQCAVTLLRGEESATTLQHSPALGWDALAKKVKVHEVPSRHSDMLSDPAAARLIADALASYAISIDVFTDRRPERSS